MSFLQWRRFNFFDKEILRNPEKGDFFESLKDINISTSTSGKGFYIVGDFDGFLHFLSRDLEMQSMKAYDVKVTHLYQLKNHYYLVSVGQDNATPQPVIKVWNLEKGFNKYGQIPCVRNVKITFGTKTPVVSCLTAHENLTMLVVGLSSGHVLLYKGNFIRERNPSSAVKPRLFHQATSPVTNLALSCTRKWERVKTIATSSTSTLQKVNLSTTAKTRPTGPMSEASTDSTSAYPQRPPIDMRLIPYTVLFVTTLDSVLSFTFPTNQDASSASTRSSVPGIGSSTPTVLDPSKGCAPDCGTLMSISRQAEGTPFTPATEDGNDGRDDEYYVVARTEALYFYGPDCLGPCLAFESPKLSVAWLPTSRYLVTIEDKPQLPFSSPPPPITTTTTVDHQSGQRMNSANILTIYDVANKFIAFSAPVPRVRKFFAHSLGPSPTRQSMRKDDDVTYSYLMLTEGVYLFGGTSPQKNTSAGQVLGNALLICREKSTRAKLEILFRKNLYDLALGLVRTHLAIEPRGTGFGIEGGRSSSTSPIMGHIFKLYGDHLYARGDFENSITQYCKTVGGTLEPSYVVRKFLDASKIKLLSTYLEALHAYHIASRRLPLSSAVQCGDGKTPPTDQPADKMSLITTVGTGASVDQLSPHHTTLLVNCYVKTGELSKLNTFVRRTLPHLSQSSITQTVELLTGRPEPGYREMASNLAKEHHLSDIYIKMMVEDDKNYAGALEYVTTLEFELAESAMRAYGSSFLAELPVQTIDVLVWLCCDYGRGSRSKAEDFINVFVNDSEHLTTFLERVIAGRIPSDKCSSLVYDTLLELYLADLPHQASVVDPCARLKRESQIMDILKDPGSAYNIDQALILCQRFGLPASAVPFLYQRKAGHGLNFVPQITCPIFTGAEANSSSRSTLTPINSASIMGELNKMAAAEGRAQQRFNLWTEALSHYAAVAQPTPDNSEGGGGLIHQILACMDGDERRDLMPSPLEVVKLLDTTSPHGHLPFSAIKDYLINHFKRERSEIERNENLVAQYLDQIEANEEQTKNLLTKPHVFQISKCSACGHSLETPAVYFVCHHGFHQNCYDSYGTSYDYNFSVNALSSTILSEVSLVSPISTNGRMDSRTSLLPTLPRTNRSCCPVCFNTDEGWKTFRKLSRVKEARDLNGPKYHQNFHTQLEGCCVWDGKSTPLIKLGTIKKSSNISKNFDSNNPFDHPHTKITDDVETVKGEEDGVVCENMFALLSKYLGQNVFEKVKLVTDKDIPIPNIAERSSKKAGTISKQSLILSGQNKFKDGGGGINPFSSSDIDNCSNPFPIY